MFKRKPRRTCSIHGDYNGEVCGFCAMGNRLKDLDRNALIQTIKELEAQVANFKSDAYVLSLLTKLDGVQKHYDKWILGELNNRDCVNRIGDVLEAIGEQE